MPDKPKIRYALAKWPRDMNAIRSVRSTVFIQEQNVSPEEEWDGEDDRCLHVLASTEDGAVVGTARLKPDGQIGRMAVTQEFRGHGIGGEMLEMLVTEAAERGHAEVFLHSQVHAIPFYAAHGFIVEGKEFMDANIPHKTMRRQLDRSDERKQ